MGATGTFTSRGKGVKVYSGTASSPAEFFQLVGLPAPEAASGLEMRVALDAPYVLFMQRREADARLLREFFRKKKSGSLDEDGNPLLADGWLAGLKASRDLFRALAAIAGVNKPIVLLEAGVSRAGKVRPPGHADASKIRNAIAKLAEQPSKGRKGSLSDKAVQQACLNAPVLDGKAWAAVVQKEVVGVFGECVCVHDADSRFYLFGPQRRSSGGDWNKHEAWGRRCPFAVGSGVAREAAFQRAFLQWRRWHECG